jgi:hypothetical protein
MPKDSRGSKLVAAIRAEMAEFGVVPTSTEEELLRLASSLADQVEQLETIVQRDGQIVTTPTGNTKTNPALIELRQQASALARVMSSIYIGDSTSGKKNPVKQRAVRQRWDRDKAS